MKKLSIFILLFVFGLSYSQTNTNRFFYELTYKPKKDSTKTEKVLMSLDIVNNNKSIFRDFTVLAQDSLIKAKVDEMMKTKNFRDVSKEFKKPKFSFKITKTYPEMQVQYSESIMNGMTAMWLGYIETPSFNWKILPEKRKIGEYEAQKATTTFGGRVWAAWFSNDIPFPDGPYKFNGLPGLIVKIEDEGKNFSWILVGNKKIENFEEQTQIEKFSRMKTEPVIVTKEKFTKTFNDYKKDPFSSIKNQMPTEMLSQKMPGQEKTIGEMIKEQEKEWKEYYNSIDEIELTK